MDSSGNEQATGGTSEHLSTGVEPTERRVHSANFWRYWLASTISFTGDGMRDTAMPLLAASLTRSPTLIAGLTAATGLPWLLVAVFAGAYVDRRDRRAVMWRVDALRALLMGGFVGLLVAGFQTMAILYALVLLLGSGETFFFSATVAALPAMVPREAIGRANSLLFGAQIISRECLGTLLGAALFGAYVELPFAVDAASFAAAAGLALTLRGAFAPAPRARQTRLRSDLADGLRYVLATPLLRAMAVLAAIQNFVLMGCIGISVLFALDVLHAGPVGYASLFVAQAIGSVAGSALATTLIRRVGYGKTLLVGRFVSGSGFVVVGLSSHELTAAAGFGLIGFGLLVSSVTSTTLRQLIVDNAFLGRVASTSRAIAFGAWPLGALSGGLVAHALGLRAPFIIGGVFAMLALGSGGRLILGADAMVRLRMGVDAPADGKAGIA